MSKKNKVLFILVFLLVISGGIIRSTFSFWTQNFSQSGENVIASDCFHITLSEEKGILLENSFPMYDKDGKKLTPYTFQVRNECSRKVEYQLNFETTSNTTLNETYVKFMFQNDEPVLLNKLESTEVTLSNGKSAYVLEQGYMKEEEVRDYQIRIWMDDRITSENQDAMNKIFEGKVTIIASYLKDYDEEKPIANFTYTRENGKLIVDASSSVDHDSNIIKYYYSLDGENFVESTESSYTFEEIIEYGLGVEYIRKLEQLPYQEIYVKVEDSFRNMSDVVRKNVQELIYDETIDNNLRYIGSDPNNYVSFNNEVWRVIGVMNHIDDGTGKKESRIKLIRSETMGKVIWDYKDGSNYGTGINEWSNATGRTSLQNFYINRVNSISKSFVSNAVWHTGTNGYHDPNNILTKDFYQFERSANTGKICSGGQFCTDSVSRTTKVVDVVGLLYPSDFGYATAGGISMSREKCLDTLLTGWNNALECVHGVWLANVQWTIMPMAESTHAQYVYHINNGVGGAGSGYREGIHMYPSVYLKSNVQFIGGSGSKENPFVLGL